MTLIRTTVLAAAVLFTTSGVLAQESRPAASQPAASANPAAEGFDLEGSDAKAIEIADATMEAMGGRAAWDATRYITWKFFDIRKHVWDKHTGDVRIEFTTREGDDYVVLSNIHTGKGKATFNGEPVTGEDLDGLMERARAWWINDSYWIVMPYKLKDSGVTLTYVGEDAMEDGRDADVLQLVFEGVGVSPQNKYHVWVARDTGLVEQWAFYRNAADEEPGFITPWHNWQKYGEIMLSDDRGMMQNRPTRHTGVAVYDKLPRSVFESTQPIELPNMGAMQDRQDMNPLEQLAPLVGQWSGTITIHNPAGEDRSIPIAWTSAWTFGERYLRFEFTSTEANAAGRFVEWVGYFTTGDDGETIETVWMNPAIRAKTDRFLDSNLIFMERGTFDSSGTVLTLHSQQQAAADAPEETIRSVFTLIDPDHFTVVDMDHKPGADEWSPKGTFDLRRK